MNIKEASEVTGVSADTIRYYERVGLIPPVPRNPQGIRTFSSQELNWIEFAKRFRAAGMSIETLTTYIELFRAGDSTIPARLKLMTEERDRLQEKLNELQACVEKLNYKIEYYAERVLPIEKTLAGSDSQEATMA